MRISPNEGVVPPSGIPAHSSTRYAPPSCALTALSTELAQISILDFPLIYVFFLSISIYIANLII
jgi:hypothetical protein